MRSRMVAGAAGVAAALLVNVDAASAGCTRLAFSVNDYGKEGPTKDAKSLLDKYIAKWTAERGIKNYTVGPKDVSCKLFLDFIVFDEHDCTATASVCWPGDAPIKVKDSQGPTPSLNKAAETRAKAQAAKPAQPAGTAPIATGSVKPPPAQSVAPSSPKAAGGAGSAAPTPARAPGPVTPTVKPATVSPSPALTTPVAPAAAPQQPAAPAGGN